MTCVSHSTMQAPSCPGRQHHSTTTGSRRDECAVLKDASSLHPLRPVVNFSSPTTSTNSLSEAEDLSMAAGQRESVHSPETRNTRHTLQSMTLCEHNTSRPLGHSQGRVQEMQHDNPLPSQTLPPHPEQLTQRTTSSKMIVSTSRDSCSSSPDSIIALCPSRRCRLR